MRFNYYNYDYNNSYGFKSTSRTTQPTSCTTKPTSSTAQSAARTTKSTSNLRQATFPKQRKCKCSTRHGYWRPTGWRTIPYWERRRKSRRGCKCYWFRRPAKDIRFSAIQRDLAVYGLF